MPRRRVDEGIDSWLSGNGAGGGIEILDPGSPTDPVADEQIESSSGSTSPLRVLAAVGLGLLAAVGVVRTGNTPAPEPPAPSVTTLPDPPDPAELARQAEIAELESAYGVEIGEGPDLRWQQVIWNIDADWFQWLEGGFVGHDGTTEWSIRPSEVGPTVSQRESLQVDYPGYEMRYIDGGRLLMPQEADDHVLVAIGDGPPVEFELPPLSVEPQTDLVTSGRSWWRGVVVDDQVIVLGFESVQVDPDALGTRLGVDLTRAPWVDPQLDRLEWFEEDSTSPLRLDYADTDLTEREIEDLRLVRESGFSELLLRFDLAEASTSPVPLDFRFIDAPLVRIKGGVGVGWNDSSGTQWFSTSTDGATWSTTPTTQEGSLVSSGAHLYRFPFEGLTIRRSPDGGRTWRNTRTPLRNVFDRLAVVDDVMMLVNEVSLGVLAPDARLEVDVDEPYRLTLLGGGGFELALRETGEIVEAERTNLLDALVFTTPDTGEELLRVPTGAIASAAGAPRPNIAITQWDPAVTDPEWRIEQVDEVFPNAVDVRLFPGDGHVLAVVFTARGTDLYLAVMPS